MYKLENGITFRKFNVVNSLFFSVIRWYLFNVIHGHRPANLDCRITSGNDSRTEGNTSGNNYRVMQCGRSMIEMLGVLAIIAVLSVGGIAGYSKAMEKWKVNKAIGEYSYLIQGMLEHLDELRISETATQLPLIDIVKALELVPETYKKYGYSLISDPYNNYLHIFSSSKKVHISIKMGETTQNTDGSYSSPEFSTDFCMALFDNIAKPLHYALYEAHVYRTNASSLKFYGDRYCTDSVKCLRDTTLKDIYDTCKSCDKKNAACDVTLSFD